MNTYFVCLAFYVAWIVRDVWKSGEYVLSRRTDSDRNLVVFLMLLLFVFLQLLYILGVYWAGPDIASAFQVHIGHVIPTLVM